MSATGLRCPRCGGTDIRFGIAPAYGSGRAYCGNSKHATRDLRTQSTCDFYGTAKSRAGGGVDLYDADGRYIGILRSDLHDSFGRGTLVIAKKVP